MISLLFMYSMIYFPSGSHMAAAAYIQGRLHYIPPTGRRRVAAAVKGFLSLFHRPPHIYRISRTISPFLCVDITSGKAATALSAGKKWIFAPCVHVGPLGSPHRFTRQLRMIFQIAAQAISRWPTFSISICLKSKILRGRAGGISRAYIKAISRLWMLHFVNVLAS